jgi:hypothetical protein
MKYIKTFEQFVNESRRTVINEADSYNDYPAAAVKAAKQALKYRDEHGDEVDAGTAVGWTRANQLASKEKVSFDTIKRMKAFFDRHEKNKSINPKHKNEPWKDNGHVSWLLWGGDAAYKWAKDKIKDLNEAKINESPGGLDAPKTIYDDLESLVAKLIDKYKGGRKFFDALDDQIKGVTNKKMILELLKPFQNEYVLSSGGFGRTLYKLYQDNQFKCKGFASFNGKMATQGKGVTGFIPDDFKINGKKFIYVDDSYFSGGTVNKINEYLKQYDSEIKQVAVVYDGNKKKTPFVKSFYRYY